MLRFFLLYGISRLIAVYRFQLMMAYIKRMGARK